MKTTIRGTRAVLGDVRQREFPRWLRHFGHRLVFWWRRCWPIYPLHGKWKRLCLVSKWSGRRDGRHPGVKSPRTSEPSSVVDLLHGGVAQIGAKLVEEAAEVVEAGDEPS